jgi:hypothetical protein
MHPHAVILLCLVLLGTATPALAANEERYGYITVNSVQIRLDNDTAFIHLTYSVDEGMRVIFFLLGYQDLKNKLLTILNYEDARMADINLSQADFIVYQAAYSYGNGVYWYPYHHFNILIPKLTVESPQVIRNFSNTDQFPVGIGYFGNGTTY